MFICNDCKKAFNKPDTITDKMDFWGCTGVSLETYVCPLCGSEDVEDVGDDIGETPVEEIPTLDDISQDEYDYYAGLGAFEID